MSTDSEAQYELVFKKISEYKADLKERERKSRAIVRECLLMGKESAAQSPANDASRWVEEWQTYNCLEKFFEEYRMCARKSQILQKAKDIMDQIKAEEDGWREFNVAVKEMCYCDGTAILAEEKSKLGFRANKRPTRVQPSRAAKRKR